MTDPYDINDPDGLNRRQRLFLEAYKLGHTATAAYKAAGYTCNNDRVAHTSGSKMLKLKKIQKALAKVQKRHVVKHEVTKEIIVSKLLAFADLDIGETMDADGKFLPVHKWSHLARFCIKGIKFTPAGNIEKVDFVDKLKAIELLGKHIGMFVDKKELTLFSGEELVKRLQEGRERVALMMPDSVEDAVEVETKPDDDST